MHLLQELEAESAEQVQLWTLSKTLFQTGYQPLSSSLPGFQNQQVNQSMTGLTLCLVSVVSSKRKRTLSRSSEKSLSLQMSLITAHQSGRMLQKQLRCWSNSHPWQHQHVQVCVLWKKLLQQCLNRQLGQPTQQQAAAAPPSLQFR